MSMNFVMSMMKMFGRIYIYNLDIDTMSSIRCIIIIFLGLAKHTTKAWKDIGIVNSKDYVLIQNCVDSMNLPTKIGYIQKRLYLVLLE